MKIKDIFSDKRKILKFTIIAVGLVLVVLLSVIGMTYATSYPKFCAVCHIMKPEYATWTASSHSQVGCVECHVDPGLTNALKHKVVATKELYRYLSKTYELPIQMTEQIPDSRCLQCHSLKRKVSASYPDLNIPHKLHNSKGIACVKCHQGIAHGQIVSRGMTMGGDFNQWNKAKGIEVTTTEYTVPKMDLCMDCHGRRGVTVSCEACHSGSMKPESHLDKSFYTGHGKLAKKDIKNCDTCHSFIKAPGVTSQDLPTEEDPVAKYLDSMQTGSDSNYIDYAKSNEYCAECHKKRPPTHDDNWPFNHGKEAEKDQQRCMVCHSPRPDVKGVTSKAACSSCHPSIHAKIPWRVSHPIDVPPKLAVLLPQCFQCHVKQICAGCHRTQETGTQVPAAAKSPNGTANTVGQQPAIIQQPDMVPPQPGMVLQPGTGKPPSVNQQSGVNNPVSQAEVTIKTK
ncbi:MAG: cytochrome c3 family protein [Eubacteriales bacterium]